jgi:hypothetical protein
VKNFSGTAVSGATIVLSGDPGKNTISAGDGSFTFSGLPQDANFYVLTTATGYVPTYAGPISLGGTAVTGLTLTLATAAEMTTYGVDSGKGLIGGLVTDQTLAPLSGATVTLTSKSGTVYTVNYLGGSGSTSASGKFLVPNILPGDVVKIDVTKAGYTIASYYLDGFADAATTKYIVGTATGGSCTYAIVPASASVPAEGLSTPVAVAVTAGRGCPWTAVSNNAGWLHVTAGASGTGNGTVSYTVDANAGAARYGTITVAGQTFIVTQGGTQITGSMIGTWGNAALQYDNTNKVWYTEASRTTFNADGTGTIEGIKNDGFNQAGQRIKDFYEPFVYTIGSNAEGSSTLSIQIGSQTFSRRLVVSDNGNMVIMDGVADSAWEKLTVCAKIDTAKTYSNADLTGEYYSLGFERNVANVTDPPNGNGPYMAISSIHNYSGTGSYTYVGKANSVYGDGHNGIWDDNTATVRNYTVSSDGGMTGGGGAFQGAISGNGKIFGGTGSYLSDNWVAYFFMKKGDKTYATADLAGKWAIVSFGQDNQTTTPPSMSFDAQIGTMICNSAGVCNFKLRDRRSCDGPSCAVTTNVSSGSATLSVSADGSFGTFLSGGQSPAYAGAIGNDGNTILFNTSFNPNQLYHREIFVGVRASNIGDLTLSGGPLLGDVNKDGQVNLTDAILALQVDAGMAPSVRTDYAASGVDVNGDNKIGLQEVIYILQVVAGFR